MPDINGTAGDDTLNGTAGADTINGLGGNDTINGGDGGDTLNGGDGNDVVHGDGGNDYISGSAGNDQLFGDDGDDRLEFYGLPGVAGTVLLSGGNGADYLSYIVGAQNVTALGGAGNDELSIQGFGDVTIDAGSGDDIVYLASARSYLVTLGDGIDELSFRLNYAPASATVVADFQPGTDRLSLDFKTFLTTWTGDANPFGTGYAQLSQSGGNVVLRIDRDGGGNSFQDFLVFQNQSLANFAAILFDGYLSDGSVPAAQNLTGTAGADTLTGGAGADTINGGDGNDFINGGNGADIINGGDGRDTLQGGSGSDVLHGGAGSDWLLYSSGSDQIYGDDGNDIIDLSGAPGGQGTLLVDGGLGDDFIQYIVGSENVTVAGGDGNDDIRVQGFGQAVIDGGVGNDRILLGSAKSYVVTLGSGTDLISIFSNYSPTQTLVVTDFTPGAAGDSLDVPFSRLLSNWDGVSNPFSTGHAQLVQRGADTVLQIDRDGSSPAAVFVDFAILQNTSVASYSYPNFGSFAPVGGVVPGQLIIGTEGNDEGIQLSGNPALYGWYGDDVIFGLGGGDQLLGSGGNDVLVGGAGYDRLDGGDGNDILIGGADGDFLIGGAGSDTASYADAAIAITFDMVSHMAGGGASMDGFESIENVVGSGFDDLVTGDAGVNLLIGGAGNDTLNGGGNADNLFGEDGADILNGDAGIDYLVGGLGGDTLNGGDAADALYGEDGDDVLDGGASFDTDILVGGAGNDTLRAVSGQANPDYDLIDGGAGNDTYWVDTGADLTFEAAGGGTDTVHANVTVPNAGVYLYANVENLVLEGTTAFGVGNELDNQLTGSASGNWLLGGDGADTITGLGGNDVLFGQTGADTFAFGAGSGADVIGDFVHGTDHIQLTGIYADFASLTGHFVQNGSDCALDLGGGNLIVMLGVQFSTLTAGDFLFA